MTWVRLEDQFPIHRKVALLDDATYRLHTEAIAWCSRNMTDGIIRADELRSISKRATKARAAILVQRGLWHEAGHVCTRPVDKCPRSGPDGWVVHDYLQYQPAKVRTVAKRAKERDRSKRYRDSQTGRFATDPRHGVSHGVTNAVTHTIPSRPERREGVRTVRTPRCPLCGNPTNSAYHRRTCTDRPPEAA